MHLSMHEKNSLIPTTKVLMALGGVCAFDRNSGVVRISQELSFDIS